MTKIRLSILLSAIFFIFLFNQNVNSDIYGLMYYPADAGDPVKHTVGGSFDNDVTDGDPSQLDFTGSAETEPSEAQTAATHIYYHADFPSTAYTRESNLDIYFELPAAFNPANTMEVELYTYKQGDTPPALNDTPVSNRLFTNAADFGLVHKINVDISGYIPSGNNESDLINIELRFSEYAGTIEVAYKINHTDENMIHNVRYDPISPAISATQEKQLFVKWDFSRGLTKVDEVDNTNFPIYGPLKMLFQDVGSKMVLPYSIDDAGVPETAEIKIYSYQGGSREYLPQDYYTLSIAKDLDSEDEEYLVLKIENWDHYFYSSTQYFIEWVRGPWDKAGNLIDADSSDVIDGMIFETDETPPAFADETMLDPGVDDTDVNIYGSIRMVFDELIDTEFFEKAFKLILEENGQEIRIKDFEFTYDTEEYLHRVRILPQDPLIYSKNYKISLNNNFRDVAGYSISGVNYKFATELDTTPPLSKAIYPFSGQTGLPHSTGIYIQFDGIMDEETFTTDNIRILRGSSPVGYSYIYEKEASNLFIFPTNKLIPNTTYTVNMTTGLRDLSGNSLETPITWSFTTIEQEENYASVSLSFVDNGIPAGFTDYVEGYIELVFTKDMEHSELLDSSNYVLYDGHRNVQVNVIPDPNPADQYRKFRITTKKGTYGFSWYPDNGYFYINREYKLYTLPFLKDRSGSYIIKPLIKTFKTVDTVKPRVLSTYPWGVPSDIQKIDISEKLDYARIYFDEEIVWNGSSDEEFYNIITRDVDGQFPVAVDYTLLDGTPVTLNYDAVYYSEVLDNMDYNQDGYKDDYFIEVFHSLTDSASAKEIFPEGTYEIKIKLGAFSGYEILDIQNNDLEAAYSMKFAIKNLYGDLSLDTDWFSATPSIYDTDELKTKYALKPEVKVVFTDKLVRTVPDFDAVKVRQAIYILPDTDGDGIFTDETPVYGTVSYDEVSIDEALRYVVTYSTSTDLPQNTVCRFMVRSDAVNLTNINGAPLVSDTWYDFETMDNPVVSDVFPQGDSTGISVNSHIIVTFSESMDSSSITSDNIYVRDSEENIVSGNIYYDSVNYSARIVPSAPMTPGKDYFIVVSKKWDSDNMEYVCVKDYYGNDLAFEEIFKFTTENQIDTVKPKVISTVPVKNATNIPVFGNTFEVVFSELMDNSTIDGDGKTVTPDDRKKFHLMYNYGEELFTIDDRYIYPVYIENQKKAVVLAGEKNGIITDSVIPFRLRNNTDYYFKVDNTVQDLSGNNLDNTGTSMPGDSGYVIRFRTETEAVAPVVEYSGVDTSSDINVLRVDFSEVMKYVDDISGFFSIQYRPDLTSSWTLMDSDQYSVISSTKVKYRNTVPPYYKQEVTSVILVPATEFANGYYRVAVASSNGVQNLTDLSSNAFGGTLVNIEIKDDYIPQITERYPEGQGYPIIKEKAYVWMTFSEEMNSTSDTLSPLWATSVRNAANVSLEEISGNNPGSFISVDKVIYYESENGTDYNNNGSVNDRNLLFVYFSQDLDTGETYRFSVANVTDADGTPDAITTESWEFSTKTSLTPPVVEKITLINSPSNANKVVKIKIQFITDSEIDTDLININPSSYVQINKLESAVPVPVTFSWEDGNNTLILTLNNDLQLDTTYLMKISGSVQDTDFRTLDGNMNGVSEGIPTDDYIYRFRTDTSRKLLEVISSNPFNGRTGVDAGTTMSVYFDNEIDPDTVIYGNIGNINLFKTESPEVSINASVNVINNNSIIVIDPLVTLETEKNYTLILKSGETGIKSAYGYYLDGNGNQIYDTGSDNYTVTFSTTSDSDKPYVMTDFCDPVPGSTGTGIEDTVEIVFSERLHDSVLDDITKYIGLYSGTSGSGGNLIPYSYTYEERFFGAEKRFVVMITPDMMFSNLSYYSLSINTSIKDTTGNFLRESVDYSFRTEAEDFSFTAFSNPAKTNELFFIAKNAVDFDSIQISYRQTGDSIISFVPVRTSENPYVYYYKINLKQDKLGMVIVNAKAQIGATILNAALDFSYGLINSAPMKVSDGRFSVYNKDFNSPVIVYSDNEFIPENTSKAPQKGVQDELEFISPLYSINTPAEISNEFIVTGSDEHTENTGIYTIKDNIISFAGKYENGRKAQVRSDMKVFAAKDSKAPVIRMEQEFFNAPEITITDISGYTVEKIKIDDKEISVNNISGKVIHQDIFGNLSYGNHDIELEVVDGVGNRANYSSRFLAPGVFSVYSTVIYPNPASDYMQVSYDLGTPTVSRLTISIYDVSGKRVYRNTGSNNVGRNVFMWDLCDDRGRKVANGVYFIKIKAVSGSGENVEKILKAAVLR